MTLHRFEALDMVSGTNVGIFTAIEDIFDDDTATNLSWPFMSLDDPRDHNVHPPYICWFTSNGYKHFRKCLKNIVAAIEAKGVACTHLQVESTEFEGLEILYRDKYQIVFRKETE